MLRFFLFFHCTQVKHNSSLDGKKIIEMNTRVPFLVKCKNMTRNQGYAKKSKEIKQQSDETEPSDLSRLLHPRKVFKNFYSLLAFLFLRYLYI